MKNTFVNSNYHFITIDSTQIILGNGDGTTSLSGQLQGEVFTSDYRYYLCNNREKSCQVKCAFERSGNMGIFLSTQDTMIYSFFGKKGPLSFIPPEEAEFFKSWKSIRIQKLGGLNFDIPMEDMTIYSSGALAIQSGLLPDRKGEKLTANIDQKQMKIIDHFAKCMNPKTFSIFQGEVADAYTKILITLNAEGQEHLFSGYFIPPYFNPFWTFIVRDYRNLEFN